MSDWHTFKTSFAQQCINAETAMSEIKHTPGPWSVENVEYGSEVTDDLCILAPSPSFRSIAHISRCYSGDRIHDMEKANARLIAGAPELLEATRTALAALESIANEMTVGDRFTNAGQALLDALEPCRAAIAKATGSQS